MKSVIVLYLLGTFAAALVAVLVNYLFPITISLTGTSAEGTSPDGLGEVISNLLFKIVDNPLTPSFKPIISESYPGPSSLVLL